MKWGFPDGSVVKNLPVNAGETGDVGSIPGLGRSPGGGNSKPLQYSCLRKSHGQRSLAIYSPWGRKELDTTERLSTFLNKIWKIKCSKLFGHCESFYEQTNPEIWTQLFHSNWHLGRNLLSSNLLLGFGRKTAIWEHWKDRKQRAAKACNWKPCTVCL